MKSWEIEQNPEESSDAPYVHILKLVCDVMTWTRQSSSTTFSYFNFQAYRFLVLFECINNFIYFLLTPSHAITHWNHNTPQHDNILNWRLNYCDVVLTVWARVRQRLMITVRGQRGGGGQGEAGAEAGLAVAANEPVYSWSFISGTMTSDVSMWLCQKIDNKTP